MKCINVHIKIHLTLDKRVCKLSVAHTTQLLFATDWTNQRLFFYLLESLVYIRYVCLPSQRENNDFHLIQVKKWATK